MTRFEQIDIGCKSKIHCKRCKSDIEFRQIIGIVNCSYGEEFDIDIAEKCLTCLNTDCELKSKVNCERRKALTRGFICRENKI